MTWTVPEQVWPLPLCLTSRQCSLPARLNPMTVPLGTGGGAGAAGTVYTAGTTGGTMTGVGAYAGGQGIAWYGTGWKAACGVGFSPETVTVRYVRATFLPSMCSQRSLCVSP